VSRGLPGSTNTELSPHVGKDPKRMLQPRMSPMRLGCSSPSLHNLSVAKSSCANCPALTTGLMAREVEKPLCVFPELRSNCGYPRFNDFSSYGAIACVTELSGFYTDTQEQHTTFEAAETSSGNNTQGFSTSRAIRPVCQAGSWAQEDFATERLWRLGDEHPNRMGDILGWSMRWGLCRHAERARYSWSRANHRDTNPVARAVLRRRNS